MGNFDGIRIPKELLKMLDLKTNDFIDINYENNTIIISKPKKKNVSLKELFDNYHGDSLVKEFTWDDKAGKEIW